MKHINWFFTLNTENTNVKFSFSCSNQQDENEEAILSFEFQKIRYIFDFKEKKCFLPVAFPVSHPMGYFQSWRGYQEEAELRAAEKRYGTNRAEMVVPDFLELFKERATAPFFVFQVRLRANTFLEFDCFYCKKCWSSIGVYIHVKLSSFCHPSGVLRRAVVSGRVLVLQRFYTVHVGGFWGLPGPAANEEYVWDPPHGKQALHDSGRLDQNKNVAYSVLKVKIQMLSCITKLSLKHPNIFCILCQVYRNRKWRPISSDELVPGDIVSIGDCHVNVCIFFTKIRFMLYVSYTVWTLSFTGRSPQDNLVPCDVLLLRGRCIVDEAMLTGESVPQMKVSIYMIPLYIGMGLDIRACASIILNRMNYCGIS